MTFDEYFKERGFDQSLLESCDGSIGDDSIFYHMFDYAYNPQGYVERRLNSEPRYVNGLSSSDSLYPIHITRPFIEDEGEAIVVEGPSDALSLIASNAKNVVSFQGASNFGKRKVRTLRRFCSSIWFIFDRDESGLRFAKHVQYRLNLDFPIFMSFIPVGFKDPSEFIGKGHNIQELSKFPLHF